MIRINLLSEGRRHAAVRRTKPATLLEGQNIALVMLVAGILLVGALPAGAWWWMNSQRIDDNRERIAEAQREVDELAAIIREVEEFKARQAELERKIGVINDLRRNQSGPVRVMDDVSRALPELLWIDKLSLRGQTVQLNGRSFNTNAVASFIDNLDKVANFNEPILNQLERRGRAYSYSITFGFTNPPLPEEVEDAAPGDETAGPLDATDDEPGAEGAAVGG